MLIGLEICKHNIVVVHMFNGVKYMFIESWSIDLRTLDESKNNILWCIVSEVIYTKNKICFSFNAINNFQIHLFDKNIWGEALLSQQP